MNGGRLGQAEVAGEAGMKSLQGTELVKGSKIDRRCGFFRLGLFDPDPDSQAVQLIGEVFSGDENDRCVLELVVKKYQRWIVKHPEVHRCLGVFPVTSSGQMPGQG